MADVDITIADNIAASIATKIKAIGTAAKSSYSAVEKLKTSLAGFSSVNNVFNQSVSSATKLTTAVNRTNSAVGALRGNVTQLNTGLGQTARTANQAAAGLNQAGNAAQRTNQQFQGVSASTRQIVGLLAAGFGVRAFLQAADAATTVANKVRLASSSLDDFNTNQAAVYQIATTNRVAVEGVATAFQRYSVALQGVTDSKGTLDFVDLLTKSLITNGATVSETDAAITQLSQSFQKGKLDGDEFRTVMETLPAVSLALTKALGVTKDQLFSLSKAGKITPQVILKAFRESADGIRAAFATTVPTIEQSLEVLKTKLTQFMSENTAASRLLSTVILGIANSLNFIIPLVLAFGAAWAAVQLGNIIQDMFRLTQAFVAYLPTLIPAVIATAEFAVGFLAAAAAALGLAEVIAFLTGNFTQFNAWLQQTSDSLVNFVAGIANSVTSSSTGFGQITTAAQGLNSTVQSTTSSTKALGDQFTKTGTTATKAAADIDKSMQRVGNTIDNLIWKMNQGASKANELYAALAAVGGSQGSFQNAGVTNTGKDSSITSIPRPTSTPLINHFATGGQFMVDGRGGTDQNRVTMDVSKGERVTIETPAQQRQAKAAVNDNRRNVYVTIVTPDADSFRQSRKQVASQLRTAVGS